MQTRANIGAFENLQNNAHSTMGMSEMGAFNDHEQAETEVTNGPPPATPRATMPYPRVGKSAIPSLRELRAAYSPGNVGQSLAIAGGMGAGGALLGAGLGSRVGAPTGGAIVGAAGGLGFGSKAAVNRPISEWKPLPEDDE